LGKSQQEFPTQEHREVDLAEIQSEVIGEEQQKELIEKFDTESATRELPGLIGKAVSLIAIAMAVFHLYTSAFGLLDTMKHRAIHLSFLLVLGYLMYPASRKKRSNKPTAMDYILAAFSASIAVYICVQFRSFLFRGGMPNRMDIVMFVICTVVVLEAVRRIVGMQLMVIAIVFLIYGYFGPYLPGVLAHRGASISRLTDHLFMIPEGFFSIALGTSSTFIVLFVIFSAFLERSGLAGFINDICMAIVGGAVGGPAKVSVVTSALFGTISGSAAANVVTTGAFTIPLMKKTGYPKEFAGAVEAVASTGGQLMPPVMGSAAFIMADYLGIAYFEIVKAAIVPVFLYYLGCFVMVHLRATKLGLRGVSRESLPNMWQVLKERGHLTIPFVAVVIMLMMRYTPLFAGSWGIAVTVIITALKKETRMGWRDILWSLENGAKRSVGVGVACASVGIVIGICTLTGISNVLGNYIMQFSQGNLMLTLFLVMLLSILMGMGLPTVAVYVLLVSVAVPIIVGLKVPPLAAHFFIFYFGMMANVTPPVAIPAYAAAGIANANPSKVGWAAFKLALPGFMFPYIFIYNPAMLMLNANVFEIFYSALSPTLGVFMIATAVEGYLFKPLSWWKRLLMLAGSFGLLHVGLLTDVIGLAVFILVAALQKYGDSREPASTV
jgi:TRAP transporter 4TM/12TM fusion protein